MPVIVFAVVHAEGAERKPAVEAAPRRLDGALLTAQFARAIESQDTLRFSSDVVSNFGDATLLKLLRSGSTDERRAAAYALGAVGKFESNLALARGLKDSDVVVRSMTDRALRAVWFRADTPENNERLRKIMTAIELERFDQALDFANDLIARAPGFAEAWNQRAIIHFFNGRTGESISDCRKTIELNPVHLGALAGLGQCHLRMGDRAAALGVFRRALEINPFDQSLKATVDALQAAN
jgi:Flp pilus assembly protein TadD